MRFRLHDVCGAALNRHYAGANLTPLALSITRQKSLYLQLIEQGPELIGHQDAGETSASEARNTPVLSKHSICHARNHPDRLLGQLACEIQRRRDKSAASSIHSSFTARDRVSELLDALPRIR